ncbi:origin recognition complex, subunit 4, partial [Aureobasidium melanogenum]
MELPRSPKRRKLETIAESPQRTTATTAPPPVAAANKTPRRDQHEVRDTIRVASVATPSSLNLTPSKPTPRPAPMSATKSNTKIGGLMARLNAKIAESQSPQKSPVKNGSNGTPAPSQPELQELEKSVKVKTLSQKLRESFEQEQLERAAKRKPKRTLEDQMRDIQDASRREVQGDRATLSPVKVQAPPTTEKRKPGRPRKHPIVDVDTTEDDGPVSPSKLASARKPQYRAMSPMLLDVNGTKQPQFTPRKPISSPLKPRPKAMIHLDVEPTQTNASANLSISSSDVQAIQSAILDQLQERAHTPFVGLSSEYDKIASVVDQTIVAGESNSILIIGARGTGKSAVLDTILQAQYLQNPDLFHVVRLNGFIHTDDKIALRDIWRQLGKQADAEDEFTAQNAADTLTTLLALLSHPEELGRSADQVTKSVVFVLDEFDLFTTHPRQTLLYNLFDIAQSRKAPIAVIGTTTRFDVVEQLEKRVKSRFSHRYVHLSSAANLSAFREMCQNALLPSSAQDVSEEGKKVWKEIVNDLFTTESFNTHLRGLYYLNKSVRAFHTSMLVAVSTLPTSGSSVQAEDLLNHLSDTTSLSLLTPPDSKLAALASLSTLQLALLIAAARLTIIHDTETVTFALAHAEYVSLASKAKIAASASGQMAVGGAVGRVWSKEVCKTAWEGLERRKLVMAEGKVGAFRVDVRLEEIGEAEVELGTMMAKWCREI